MPTGKRGGWVSPGRPRPGCRTASLLYCKTQNTRKALAESRDMAAGKQCAAWACGRESGKMHLSSRAESGSFPTENEHDRTALLKSATAAVQSLYPLRLGGTCCSATVELEPARLPRYLGGYVPTFENNLPT